MTSIKKYTSDYRKNLIESIMYMQDHEYSIYKGRKKAEKDFCSAYVDYILRQAELENGCTFVAVSDRDEYIGFVNGWIEEDTDEVVLDSNPCSAYISDIFVNESFRGKGIAKILLKHTENYFRKFSHLEKIRICSLAKNTLACRAYEGTGYKPYEVIFEKSL